MTASSGPTSLLSLLRSEDRADRHVDPHAFRADDRLEQRDDLRRQVVLDALLPLHLGAARRLVVRAGRPRERPAEAVEDDDRFGPEPLHAGRDEVRDALHCGMAGGRLPRSLSTTDAFAGCSFEAKSELRAMAMCTRALETSPSVPIVRAISPSSARR